MNAESQAMPTVEPPTAEQPSAGQATQGQGGYAIGGIELGGTLHIPPGTYQTYRQMIADPTIALADAVARAPIMAASWSIRAEDDAPAGAEELVDHVFTPLIRKFKRHALKGGLRFGWQPWEKIFELEQVEGRQAWVIRRLRALKHDITTIEVIKATGAFDGFKNNAVTLPLNKSLLFTHDPEHDDDHYGRSRLENLRRTFQRSEENEEAAGRYVRKVAGVFVIIHFPPGKTKLADGTEKPNNEIARELGAGLRAGTHVAIENAFAQSLNSRVPNATDKTQWQIELKEDSGGRQAGFSDRGKSLDVQKFRGYFVPERAASEGQFGTKAEAETHGDLILTIGEELHEDIFDVLNWHAVDQVLALNFGDEARGSVKLEPAPLMDRHSALFRKIIETIIATPPGFEWAQLNLKLESLAEELGLPLADNPQPVDPDVDDDEDDDATKAAQTVEEMMQAGGGA